MAVINRFRQHFHATSSENVDTFDADFGCISDFEKSR